MKLPLSWIRELVEVDLPARELAHRLTMSGTEVEDVEIVGRDWEKVVVGRIVKLEPHPSLVHLRLASVDLGASSVTLATTASNVNVGDVVPVALPGGRVNALVVEARDFGGVRSEGILLSADELGIGVERDEVYVLEDDGPPGQAFRDYLDEAVLDLSITPNRPDEMSVLGIAREVAVLTGRRLTPPPLQPLEGTKPASELIVVEIPDPDLCLRYSAAVVLGVSVGPAPRWMQRRLHFSGVRPINNIVDITNYVMLEQGQPLHGFDRALLAGGLIIRRARPGERLVTLDGQERELTEEMLVIADSERAQALAGVMGGLASEVGASTLDVVIESANFHPINIRRTARALRISTEASRRFERGLDPGQTARAAQRAANLMVELAGGTATSGIADAYPTRLPERRIVTSAARISAFLGQEYETEEVIRVLTGLGFEVREGSPEQPDDHSPLATRHSPLEVTPPGHRRDVEGSADLAEEVARITGYDRIPNTLPAGRLPEPRPNPARTWEQKIKRTLAACGLQEVITYSLVDPNAVARLNSTGSWPEPIPVANPMSVEQSVLRTTLLGSLAETVRANLRHTERVAIFELARVYLPPLDPLPREVRRLAVALVGPRSPLSWNRQDGRLDFFDLKGIIEQLLHALGLQAQYHAVEHPCFHPGRVAQLALQGPSGAPGPIGVLGQLHPAVAERFDLERVDVLAAELDVEALFERARDVGRVAPPPRFPAVVMDLAVQVDEAVTHEEIIRAITRAGQPLLEQAVLFDVYSGSPLPEGTRSLAYSLAFRSPERTLTDAEAAQVMKDIERELAGRFGATIRGR